MTKNFDELVHRLKNKSPDVRENATVALGKLGDTRAVEPLIAILEDVKVASVGASAAEALGKLGDLRAVEPLITILKDENWQMRAAAAEALEQLGDFLAMEPLIAILEDTDWQTRKAAAKALRQFNDPRSVEPLIATMSDEFWEVRRTAAESLDRLDWKPKVNHTGAVYWIAKQNWNQCVKLGTLAVKPLIVFLRDRDNDVRKAVARTLGQLGDTRAVEPLIAVLQDVKVASVGASAAEALGELGDSRAVEPLIITMSDKFWEVRRAAAESLDRLGWKPKVNHTGAVYWIAKQNWNQCVRLGTLAVKPLITTLTDESKRVRMMSAEILGELGDARAVEPLTIALGDRSWQMRGSAALSLAKLGDSRAVESLISVLTSRDGDMCGVVVTALGKSDDTRAVEALITALGDRSWQMRGSAALSLGELGDSRAVEPLFSTLLDKDECPIVHNAVARALNRLGQSTRAFVNLVKKTPVILVVDDHEPLLKAIQGILEEEGYIVFTASDGTRALEMLGKISPCLIVTDIMMPRMDGYELFNRLRRWGVTVTIPVIFLTAKAEREDILMGKGMGAEDYLTKPFDPQELVVAVASRLQRARDIDGYRQDAKETKDTQDTEFLVNEIKLLRKHQEVLEYQLAEYRRKIRASSDDQFPLTELSRLTDGIIHDMRSGLGVIRHTVGFLEGDLADTTHGSDLVKISRSLDFCELALRDLGALGGHAIFQPKWVNIEAVAHEVMFILEHKLVEVEPVINTAPDTPQILADEGQVKQVFMNLIKNAGEAMPDGGTLKIRTQREGQMLRIEVSDTGCGIPPENQNQIFQEFFTTKKQGYGLGLYIVNTIINRHGGTIEVESKVGEGTTFTLHLPIEPE
ncbi:MAG: response regulator [Chloroflexi bacterium]|nr:response regulator [Chloroflexota bacterium]